MGEMADYFLEQIHDSEYRELFDDEWQWPGAKIITCKYCKKTGLRWGKDNGKYKLFEDWERTIIHECLEDSKLRTCKRCQKTGLRWGMNNGKYRLFDGGIIHECKVESNDINTKKEKEEHCECCGRRGHLILTEVTIFGKKINACAYCRKDAVDTLRLTCLWSKPKEPTKEQEMISAIKKNSPYGYAIVFN